MISAVLSAVAIASARVAMQRTYNRLAVESSPPRLLIVDGEKCPGLVGYTVLDAQRVGPRPAMNEPVARHSN